MYLDERTLKIHNLTECLADMLMNSSGPQLRFLEALDLQPTTGAARLAAQAAVSVLLAHELGQTVAQDAGVMAATLPVNGNGNGHPHGPSISLGRRGKVAPKGKVIGGGSAYQKVECPDCHQLVSKSQLGNHRRKKHSADAAAAA